MQRPSPPSRTGTPGSNAATRSTIGKSRQPPMLSGLTVPVGRWIGPAEAMPTPRTAVSAVVSVISRSTTAQTASASPCGVGSVAV